MSGKHHHKELIRVRVFKEDDQDGSKTKMLLLWHLCGDYRRHGGEKRAIALYCAVHECRPDELKIPLTEVIREMDAYIKK